jgi:hypothetical protein
MKKLTYAEKFDKKLDIHRQHIPVELRDAFIYVHDTLEFCHAMALSVMGEPEKVDSSTVLGIYEFVQAELKKQQGQEEDNV